MLTRNELIDSKKDFEALGNELAHLDDEIKQFHVRHPGVFGPLRKQIRRERLRVATRIKEIDRHLQTFDAGAQLIPIHG